MRKSLFQTTVAWEFSSENLDLCDTLLLCWWEADTVQYIVGYRLFNAYLGRTVGPISRQVIASSTRWTSKEATIFTRSQSQVWSWPPFYLLTDYWTIIRSLTGCNTNLKTDLLNKGLTQSGFWYHNVKGNYAKSPFGVTKLYVFYTHPSKNISRHRCFTLVYIPRSVPIRTYQR